MRAALIGFGPHGRRLLSALGETPAVQLVAVADRRAEAFAQSPLPAEIERFESSSTLFEKIAPDLVCIATNGPSHASIALEAIRHGATHVLVEKPMACSLDACDRMIEAADRAGARMVVVSRRPHPLYRWLRAQIGSGVWGEFRSIFIQQPGIGLGCLGVHAFDQIAFLAQRRIERVTAWVDPFRGPNPRGAEFVDPGGTVVLELGGPRAILAQIEGGAGPMAMELDLAGARIQIDEEVRILERDLSVKPGPDRPPVFRRIDPPDLAPKPTPAAVLRGAIDELIASGPIECSAEAGRDAVEVLVAAHLSHRRGNVPVALPLRSSEERSEWLSVT